MDYDEQNQFNENMIDDDMNNMNNYDEENNEYNQYNNQYNDQYNDQCNDQYNEYEQYEEENNNDNGNDFNENDLYKLNEDNIELKNKCENLYKSLLKKNKELEQYKNEYLKIKQGLNKYIKIIQNLKNELNSTNQKYLDSVKEVRLKNKMISDLQNGINIKDINIEKYKDEQNDNIIISINDQIKNIEKDFFEEEEEEKAENDIDKIKQNELENMDKNAQIQILMNNINSFSEKLNEYKMNNMQEIMNLRNLIESNNNIKKNNSNNNFNIKDQYYLNIIDIIKNLGTNMSNNSEKIGNFPNFSLNDENEIKYKNIFITIKILADYIIANNNAKNRNNNINEELNKRLKEMSELLIKSNENLNKSRKDNMELKQKYNQLESNYNSIINRNENNNNNNDIDKEKENLREELNKKNQEIKSLEHMVTRLTNNKDKNDDNSIKIENNSKKGKIITNNKNGSLYFKLNKFVKNDKNEKNLQKFLDKFTNGEYGGSPKLNQIDIKNLKEEVDKLSIRINNEIKNIK